MLNAGLHVAHHSAIPGLEVNDSERWLWKVQVPLNTGDLP